MASRSTINWHYDPAAADLDWLRQGDTLTITYVAQVDDGHGNVGAQNLVITITGTNDVPTIDGATNPAAIPESAGDSSAQDIPQVDGTISITDQDLGDTLTVTRHRQCDGRLQRRRRAGRELGRCCGADRQRRHQLRPAPSPMASRQTSTGTTTRPRPTSTGCAQGDTLTLTYRRPGR